MRPRRRRQPGRAAHRPAVTNLTLAVMTLAGAACLGILGSTAGAVTPGGPAHVRSARLLATPHYTGPSPTVTATPIRATAPAVITLSGTDFDPAGSSVTCQFTSGTPATSTTLTLAHTGAVSGTIRLTSSDAVGTNPIKCTQTATHAALSATAAFAVTAIAPTCSLTTAPLACATSQVVGTTVTGTDLSTYLSLNSTPNASGGVNPTNTLVAFSKVTLGSRTTSPACRTPHATHICTTSAFVASNGTLNTIVVNDNRGDLAGWTVTGQMASDFQGPAAGHNHSIPADDLTWVPSVSPESTSSCVTLGSAQTCAPSDVLSEISAGPAATLSTSTSTVLCQATPGGGGGGTKCTAKLILAIPPYIVAGRYTATIDIVVS